MPEINKPIVIKITAEQFLDACSVAELIELDLILYSPRYQDKIKAVRRIDITPINTLNP
jgi:hypothetical protein